MGYRNDIYNIRVRRLPVCCIPHSYALLRRIALSSVVFRSFCRSVSLLDLQKRLKRSSCHLRSRTRVGPMNHVLNEVQMPTWDGTNLRENRQTIVKYRDTPRSCAKTAESIEVPFGLWTRMDRKHHVLHGRSRSPMGRGNSGG